MGDCWSMETTSPPNSCSPPVTTRPQIKATIREKGKKDAFIISIPTKTIIRQAATPLQYKSFPRSNIFSLNRFSALGIGLCHDVPSSPAIFDARRACPVRHAALAQLTTSCSRLGARPEIHSWRRVSTWWRREIFVRQRKRRAEYTTVSPNGPHDMRPN